MCREGGLERKQTASKRFETDREIHEFYSDADNVNVSTLAHVPEISPVVTKQAKSSVRLDENKQVPDTRYYVHRSTSTQRSATNEQWYTIPYRWNK